MAPEANITDVAAALRDSIGLLRRRLRQVKAERAGGNLTLPESAALVRLDRGGPTTPSALARQEQISPQSMGATVAALEARRLVERRPDPHDGRRAVISVTETGLQVLRDRRNAHAELLAQALADGFTQAELDVLAAAAPLLERLAERL
jgi:DNA-binding MarR family transcriptional regulator